MAGSYVPISKAAQRRRVVEQAKRAQEGIRQKHEDRFWKVTVGALGFAVVVATIAGVYFWRIDAGQRSHRKEGAPPSRARRLP